MMGNINRQRRRVFFPDKPLDDAGIGKRLAIKHSEMIQEAVKQVMAEQLHPQHIECMLALKVARDENKQLRTFVEEMVIHAPLWLLDKAAALLASLDADCGG